jgi:hypothetical protein
MSRVACFLIALVIAPAAAADSTSTAVNVGKCAALKAVAEKEEGATTSAAEAEAQHVLRLAPDYQLALNVMRMGLDELARLEKRGNQDAGTLFFAQGARACEAVGIQWWRWR